MVADNKKLELHAQNQSAALPGVLSVVCTVLCSFATGYLFTRLLSWVFPDPIIRAPGTVTLDAFPEMGPVLVGGSPEPVESYSYYLFLVASCAFAFLFAAIFTRLFRKDISSKTARDVTAGSLLVLAVAVVFLFVWGISRPVDSANPFLSYSGFALSPLTAAIAGVVIVGVYVLWRCLNKRDTVTSHSAKYLGVAAPLLTCAAILVVCIFSFSSVYDPNPEYASKYHFSVIFHPVYIISQGGSLGVETRSLYGNFPYVLYYLQRLVFGRVDLYNTMLTCSLFCMVTNLFFFGILKKWTRSNLIALAGALSVIYITQIFPQTYFFFAFQGSPARTFAPAGAVFLLACCNSATGIRQKLFYWASVAFCGFGVLWNPETGLVAVLATLAYHAYTGLQQHQITKLVFWKFFAGRVLAVLLSVAVWFAGLVAFTWARSGVVLGFTDIIWPIITAQYGFTLLPIPENSPYYFVLLVYVVALAWSIYCLRPFGNAKNKQTNAILFLLSITGFGLFIYYLGRSAAINLCYCVWPAFLIVAFAAYYLVKHVTAYRWSRNGEDAGALRARLVSQLSVSAIALTLVAVFVLVGTSYMVLGTVPQWQQFTLQRKGAAEDVYQPVVDYIKERVPEGRDVAIVCQFSSDFASAANVNNRYMGTSLVDAYFTKDYDDIVEFFETFNGRAFVLPYLFYDENKLSDGRTIKDAMNAVFSERYILHDKTEFPQGATDGNYNLWCFDSIQA